MLSLILVVLFIGLKIYLKKCHKKSEKNFENFWLGVLLISCLLGATYGIISRDVYFYNSDLENYIKCHEQASELENIIQKFDSPSLDFTDEEINIIIEELSEKKLELEKEKLPDEEKIKFYRFLIYFG